MKIFRFPCYKKYSVHKNRLKAATALSLKVVTSPFLFRICYNLLH